MVYLDFTSALHYMDTYGLTDVFLPFVLLFTVMFAILQKIAIFKDEKDDNKPNRKVNAVLSLVISLIVVIPHVTGGYPAGYDVITIINSILPGSMLILIAVVMFIMLAGLAVGGFKPGSAYSSWVALFAVIALAYVVWNALWPDTVPSWLRWAQDPGLQSLLIILLICGLVIWFIAGEKKPAGAKTFSDKVKELFQG